jgi:hypothetical protein
MLLAESPSRVRYCTLYKDFNEIVKSESHPFPVALHARTYLEQVFNTWYNYKAIYDARVVFLPEVDHCLLCRTFPDIRHLCRIGATRQLTRQGPVQWTGPRLE